MRQQGTIATWKSDKGFGFIKPQVPGTDIFFYIADFRSNAKLRPAPGMAVSFELIHVGGKGPRAMAVRPASENVARGGHGARSGRPAHGSWAARGPAPASGAALALPLMLAYYALMGMAVFRGAWPAWVIGASLLVNLLTFFLYWQDKYKAATRAWRIPEDTLQMCSLAGGWAGAWFAQQVLRHKSAKPSFRAVYWACTVLHCAAFGWAVWRFGL